MDSEAAVNNLWTVSLFPIFSGIAAKSHANKGCPSDASRKRFLRKRVRYERGCNLRNYRLGPARTKRDGRPREVLLVERPSAGAELCRWDKRMLRTRS